VFSEPIDTLLPELEGATATGENGRVGPELVFWGYRLGDGRPAFLFACAPREGVNCGLNAAPTPVYNGAPAATAGRATNDRDPGR
jgi:hypothetical protein